MPQHVVIQALDKSTAMADQEGAEVKMNPEEAVGYKAYKNLAILNNFQK